MTDNWLERTELLLGAEKLEKLRAAHVLVVGLGGVGAYAAEMIVRAGVGRMTVADADTVILVDVFPAGEMPIPGVTSKLIYDNLRPGIEKSMCKKEEILNILKDKNIEVLITLGAGDIDNYVPEIKELLETKKLRMNNEE